MTWAERASSIKVGDRVCYSRRFLQSTGQYTGDVPQARGVVTELVPLGEITLAVVDWGEWDVPGKVAVNNLSRITERGILDLD